MAPAIKYVKFWRAYWEYASPLASPSEATIRLDHKPGEKVQVDFSDGVWLTDSTTGKTPLPEPLPNREELGPGRVDEDRFERADLRSYMNRHPRKIQL